MQTQNCIFSVPVNAMGEMPNNNNQSFQFSQMDCEFFGTSTVPVSTSTPTAIPVYFENVTSLSTSSDVTFAPFFTAGDVVIVAFFILFTTIMAMYAIGKGLARITTGKSYLQYNGGDVEVRKDL